MDSDTSSDSDEDDDRRPKCDSGEDAVGVGNGVEGLERRECSACVDEE